MKLYLTSAVLIPPTGATSLFIELPSILCCSFDYSLSIVFIYLQAVYARYCPRTTKSDSNGAAAANLCPYCKVTYFVQCSLASRPKKSASPVPATITGTFWSCWGCRQLDLFSLEEFLI